MGVEFSGWRQVIRTLTRKTTETIELGQIARGREPPEGDSEKRRHCVYNNHVLMRDPGMSEFGRET
jgi:hypothetical protein